MDKQQPTPLIDPQRLADLLHVQQLPEAIRAMGHCLCGQARGNCWWPTCGRVAQATPRVAA